MARTTTEHQIVVRSAMPSGVVREEGPGTTTLYPGYLLQLESTGYLAVHSGGMSGNLVCLENQTPDTTANPLVSALLQPYADNDTVYYAMAMPGDILQVRLTTGQETVKGVTWLQSDGAGHVTSMGTTLAAGTSVVPVGLAWEDIDAGGSAGLVLVKF